MFAMIGLRRAMAWSGRHFPLLHFWKVIASALGTSSIKKGVWGEAIVMKGCIYSAQALKRGWPWIQSAWRI